VSYDVWLVIDTGAGNDVEVFATNYTSNVAGMWRFAMERSGAGMEVWQTGGMTGAEAAPLLEGALSHMQAFPVLYGPFEPDNGWGNYEGAMKFLYETVEACEAHPLAKLGWSI
jgi:hypothetical protein